MAHAYNNIGSVYLDKVDLENALLHYQQALLIFTRVLGSDHPVVAHSYNNMANVYISQGRHEEALVQHEKALEIRTRMFGSEHPDVAHM